MADSGPKSSTTGSGFIDAFVNAGNRDPSRRIAFIHTIPE